MIISSINQKGGSGKSTIAVNLAALAASNGMATAIIDLDPQATACAWIRSREAEDIKLVVTHPPEILSTVKSLRKEGVELIIIDTPPHNSTAAANAVNVSDLCLIPVRPSAFDLNAAEATIQLIQANNGKGVFVLNSVPASTNVLNSASEFIESTGFKVIAKVGQRMAYQHAVAIGLGVTEYEPNSKAAGEIIELWNALREFTNV
jgi:chromosome partitioning protein